MRRLNPSSLLKTTWEVGLAWPPVVLCKYYPCYYLPITECYKARIIMMTHCTRPDRKNVSECRVNLLLFQDKCYTSWQLTSQTDYMTGGIDVRRAKARMPFWLFEATTAVEAAPFLSISLSFYWKKLHPSKVILMLIKREGMITFVL